MKKTYACIACLLFLVSCGTPPATTQRWQQDVRWHVETQGHGDLGVLRNIPTVRGRKVFTTLGGNNPASTTDVVGVLLGQASIQNRPTYIFLVGVISGRAVKDLRLAAVYDDGKQWACKLDNADGKALAAYQKEYTPADTVDALWPPAEDVYELAVAGNTITVTEQRTGVKWTMEVK